MPLLESAGIFFFFLLTEKKNLFQTGIVQLAYTTVSAILIRLLRYAEVHHCSSTRECIISVVAFGQRFWPWKAIPCSLAKAL